MRISRTLFFTTFTLALLLSGAAFAVAQAHGARNPCNRFASPTGSDRRGRGTRRRPFRSLTRLDLSLRPGQTGCLFAGTYGSVNAEHLLLRDGRAGHRITIRSYPGDTVKVVGWIDLQASYTTIEHLYIDGSNTLFRDRPSSEPSCTAVAAQGLSIAGRGDIFQYNDYFQSVRSLRGPGIGIGWWGDTDNTIVRFNKIHDVGGCDFYDHLIYLAHGNNVQIYGNWMWNDSHGWGIKFDPGPTNARVWDNVIDRAGSGFNFGNSSGSDPTAGNQVFDNVVMNSVGVNNPDIGWHHPGVLVTSPGLLSFSTGNLVYHNDSYHNRGGFRDVVRWLGSAQLWITGNWSAKPQFVDAAKHDFRLSKRARRRR